MGDIFKSILFCHMGMLLTLMLICPLLPSNPSAFLLLGVLFRTWASLGVGRGVWKVSVRLLTLLLEGRILGFSPNIGHLVQIWTMGSSFPFSYYRISDYLEFDLRNSDLLEHNGNEVIILDRERINE